MALVHVRPAAPRVDKKKVDDLRGRRLEIKWNYTMRRHQDPDKKGTQ